MARNPDAFAPSLPPFLSPSSATPCLHATRNMQHATRNEACNKRIASARWPFLQGAKGNPTTRLWPKKKAAPKGGFPQSML